MSDLGIGDFDANNVEPNKDFDLIPDNTWVEAMVTKSELKKNAKGTGSYVALTFDIVSGKYAKQHLWENLNLVNPNAQCVQIAKAKLSSICRAVGVLKVRDSQQLHNLPMMVKVGVEAGKDGVTRNKIKDYKPREHAAPPVQASSPTPSQAPAGAVPWGS